MSDSIKARISTGYDNKKYIDIYGLPDQAISSNGKFVRVDPSQVNEIVSQIQGAKRVIDSESGSPASNTLTV